MGNREVLAHLLYGYAELEAELTVSSKNDGLVTDLAGRLFREE